MLSGKATMASRCTRAYAAVSRSASWTNVHARYPAQGLSSAMIAASARARPLLPPIAPGACRWNCTRPIRASTCVESSSTARSNADLTRRARTAWRIGFVLVAAAPFARPFQ